MRDGPGTKDSCCGANGAEDGTEGGWGGAEDGTDGGWGGAEDGTDGGLGIEVRKELRMDLAMVAEEPRVVLHFFLC